MVDPWETEEAVETQRESSGQAPIAGVGDASDDGESHRNDGVSSFAVAIIPVMLRKSNALKLERLVGLCVSSWAGT